MPVHRSDNKIVLNHPKGASVEILYYGATVISWKTGAVERLFVSSTAVLDGSKPVRGGIPVVFPCFGAPTHPDHAKLSQHGFARSEHWTFDSILLDNEAGVSVKLVLTPTTRISSMYERDFKLAYVVTLAEHQLSTDLHVNNPSQSTADLEFHALFHNYIRAHAASVEVTPLHNRTYYDKTLASDEEKAKPRTESRTTVDVKKFTDFVYENAPGEYEITWSEGEMSIKTVNLDNVVIWNPQDQGRKIGDMEERGWEKFVCVEPGSVRRFVKISPGETWIGQQVLTVA